MRFGFNVCVRDFSVAALKIRYANVCFAGMCCVEVVSATD